jgi:hypothetical protein
LLSATPSTDLHGVCTEWEDRPYRHTVSSRRQARARRSSVRYRACRKAYFTHSEGRQIKLAEWPDDTPKGPTYLAALGRCQRSCRATKLDPFADYLRRRREEHPRSAVRLLAEIRPMGYTRSVQTVRRFLATPAGRRRRERRLTVRFETPPGHQAQADARTARGPRARWSGRSSTSGTASCSAAPSPTWTIGYLAPDGVQASLVFQVICQRRQKGQSLVLTSNEPFGEWGEGFGGDPVMASAALGRLLHRSAADIRGESSRQRCRKKAGAVARADPKGGDG